MDNLHYLTDEELSMLISDTFSGDMVSAPPDILDDIRVKIHTEELPGTVIPIDTGYSYVSGSETADPAVIPAAEKIRNDIRKKKIEFRRYCLKVTAASAAAIIMIFALPALTGANDPAMPDIGIFSSESGIFAGSGQLSDHSITDRLNDMQEIFTKNRHNIFR